MIKEISDHFCTGYGKIRLSGDPIRVYGHGEARPKGLTGPPCVAVSYLGFRIQQEYVRRTEVLTPNDGQAAVTIPTELGHEFRAAITGTVQEPYQIPAGWGLTVRVGKSGVWKAASAGYPMPGERSAEEVARSLNYWLNGIIVWAEDGRVRIETIEAAADLEIIDSAVSLHNVLGFPLGTVSHLAQSGPATWTARPHPLPIELHFQADLLSAESAQNDALLTIGLNAVQHKHWALINGHYLRFDAEPPVNLNELDKPMFRTAIGWWVGTLWVESLTEYQVPSILLPSLEWAG